MVIRFAFAVATIVSLHAVCSLNRMYAASIAITGTSRARITGYANGSIGMPASA